MKKPVFYTEAAYVLGLLIMAFGNSLLAWADFGVSMVVAPAYILHLKLSAFSPFFTFGVTEYMTQVFVLILMCICMKKFKFSYIFSFVTAVLYGLVLDGFSLIVRHIPVYTLPVRIPLFIIGMCCISCGVALFFRTYISVQSYDYFVKEVYSRTKMSMSNFKSLYDAVSLIVSIILSFAFFGLFKFRGIGIGTVACTLLNGRIIGLIGKALDSKFEFKDRFALRKFFER